METIRHTILNNICYTDLVYGRINKKLGTSLSNNDIENLVIDVIAGTKNNIEKIGKNFYIKDLDDKISLTVNSYTYRIITADKLT